MGLDVTSSRNSLRPLLIVLCDTPPSLKEIRKELDYECRINGQSIIVYEIRTSPFGRSEMPIAKTTYVKKDKVWNIYWMRANDKWETYYLEPEGDDLETFFKTVREDESMAFFG